MTVISNILLLIRLAILLALMAGVPAGALCVSASKANLREKPSSKSKVTLTVTKYTPLAEVDQKGSWYKVKDVDGGTHWVYSSLVSSRLQCLIITASKANIRKGPGTRFGLADYPVANRYFVFKKLDSEEEWYKVESPSGKGPFWIHENLVWRAMKVQAIGF